MLPMNDGSEGGTIVLEEVAHGVCTRGAGLSTMDNMEMGLDTFVFMIDNLDIFPISNHLMYVLSNVLHCSVWYVNSDREMAEMIYSTLAGSKKYFRYVIEAYVLGLGEG